MKEFFNGLSKIVSASSLAKYIRIIAQRSVSVDITGWYASVFKGMGLEFSEVRPYVDGDDIRLIDPNVTARTGKPYVKKFIEERSLNVIFAVDVSESMIFGTSNLNKLKTACYITCILALAAIRTNDKIGLVLFDSSVRKYIPPSRGKNTVSRIVAEVLSTGAEGYSDFVPLLRFLGKWIKKRSLVFILSDFLNFNAEIELGRLRRYNDISCIIVFDPFEAAPECIPVIYTRQLESDKKGFLIDLGSSGVRERIKSIWEERTHYLKDVFARYDVDAVWHSTETSALHTIMKLMKIRFYRFHRLRK